MTYRYLHRIIKHDEDRYEPQSILATFFGLFRNPMANWTQSHITGPKFYKTYDDAVLATKWRDRWGVEVNRPKPDPNAGKEITYFKNN